MHPILTITLSRAELDAVRTRLGWDHWLYKRLLAAWKREEEARQLLRGNGVQRVSTINHDNVDSEGGFVE